jgi:hypothetical protein
VCLERIQINKSNRYTDVGSFLEKIGKLDKEGADQLRIFSEDKIKQNMTRDGIQQFYAEETK